MNEQEEREDICRSAPISTTGKSITDVSVIEKTTGGPGFLQQDGLQERLHRGIFQSTKT